MASKTTIVPTVRKWIRNTPGELDLDRMDAELRALISVAREAKRLNQASMGELDNPMTWRALGRALDRLDEVSK